MDRRDKTRHTILSAACALFIKHTVSRVTVDEIASYAGISKKTLYNHFASKEELESSVFLSLIDDVREDVRKLSRLKNVNFPKKLDKLMKIIARVAEAFNNTLIEDLQRNKRPLWETIDKERRRTFIEEVMPIFLEGQKQGFIRRNVDLSFVMEIIYQNIRIISDSDFMKMSGRSLLESAPLMFDIIMNGIMTKKEIDKEER